MIHRLLLGSCLALAVAACATHAAPPMAVGNSMPAAVPVWQPTRATATAAAQTPVGCVSGTGTRLPVAPGECTGIGTVHSQTAIQQTGQPNLGPALQMIDPAVRSTGP